MKKLLSALCLAFLLPLSAMAAGSFTDVSVTHTNFRAIEVMKAFGIVNGYADGTFGAELTISRSEIMKVLVLGTGNDPQAADYDNCFTDIAGHWSKPYVCYAKAQGWVSGYEDGSYGVDRPVKRSEALKMISYAYDLDSALLEEVTTQVYSDVPNSEWYAPYVEVLGRINVLEETSGNFRPDDGLKRSTMAEYIYRLLVVAYAETAYSEGYSQGFISSNDLGFIYSMVFAGDTPASGTGTGTGTAGSDAFNGAGMEITTFMTDPYYFGEDSEYVIIKNNGSDDADLTGWYLKGYSDFYTYTYDLPSGTILSPGESLTIYTSTFGYGDDLWDNEEAEMRLYDETDYLIYYDGDVSWD